MVPAFSLNLTCLHTYVNSLTFWLLTFTEKNNVALNHTHMRVRIHIGASIVCVHMSLLEGVTAKGYSVQDRPTTMA